MSFNPIRENEILAKISEYTVAGTALVLVTIFEQSASMLWLTQNQGIIHHECITSHRSRAANIFFILRIYKLKIGVSIEC